MRVVHVTMTTSGGAGRGVLGLHEGLRRRGVDSYVVVADPTNAGTGIVSLFGVARRWTRLALRVSHYISRLLGGRPRETFHGPFVPTGVASVIRRLRPDIIHLHWIGDLLTPAQVSALAREAPTLWTLRDMAPFTGGCHYTWGCRRYETGCGRCPLLQHGNPRDSTRWIHRRRRRHLVSAPITYVALSDVLAEQASRSPWIRGTPAIIPPGIDLERFRPVDREAARERFNLGGSARVIGFIAVRPEEDPRKGLDLFQEALEHLPWVDPPTVLLTSDLMPPGAARWRPLGVIDDDELLRNLYAACDVVVVPSRQEAFGKVALEALACGVPVVGFRDTGLASIVTHRVSGYLAAPGSAPDLAAGLSWAFDGAGVRPSPLEPFELHRRFSLDGQAQSYEELYVGLARSTADGL